MERRAGERAMAECDAVLQRVLRQVKPDTVMIELDASRAGKLLAKRPSDGAGDEAAAGAGGGGGDDAGPRAPPSSIGRLAGRVLHVVRSMAMH